MSARSTFKVPDEVREVLMRSAVTATSVKLPSEQLERKLYEKVNKVLTGSGGKWDRKSGTHIFDRDPREAMGLAVEQGQAINLRTKLQAFYTPPKLAGQVVEAAKLKHGMLVLEPSAGEGALVSAALRVAAVNVVMYDLDEVALARAVVVADKVIFGSGGQARAEVQDFLMVVPASKFDAVLMNPPFTGGADMNHVSHAWRFVKPGGILVAIMSPSWRTANSKAAVTFRRVVTSAVASEVGKIPAGTFEHTNIATIVVTLRKGTN